MENEKSSPEKSIPLISTQLGVWEVLMQQDSLSSLRKQWSDFFSSVPLVYRLGKEIYNLAPGLFVFFLISQVWSGIESALLLQLSSHLLNLIELGLSAGLPEAGAIYQAVGTRFLCVICAAIMTWWSEKLQPVIRSRVTCHFEFFIMEANLKVDLPTSAEHSAKARVTARDAWDAFEESIDFITNLLQVVSQLGFIIQASRSSGGTLFALVCVAKPIFQALNRRSLWSKSHVVYSNNPNYLRMKALEELSQSEYRQDVISGNLTNYILKEYVKAVEAVADASDEWAESQYARRPSPNFDVFCEILGDLPMVYCAANAILNPSKFSVSSVAILQQSSSVLRYTLERIFDSTMSFQRHLNDIRNLYAITEVDAKIIDGKLPYPKPDGKSDLGMSFDLRNVTFSYPGSQTTAPALKDVSISIKPGQLVVIVGQNGSGKSTIVKLLSRLYGPTSGDILVDGQPINEYRISDLRQASAMLTQDHNLYPLPMGENIGLGHPDLVSDIEMVKSAAKKGGSYDFISKFVDGFDTSLDPLMYTVYGSNLPSDPKHPLREKMDALRKAINISGGERQRVVASRTFMRFNTGKVKFVAVDEPSSALDPEGELQLFEQLQEARSGKTMVFVTHRFGHLTKYADLIVCMKDGTVAESGSHEDLMALDGEYAKLYNVQAGAFVPKSEEPIITASEPEIKL